MSNREIEVFFLIVAHTLSCNDEEPNETQTYNYSYGCDTPPPFTPEGVGEGGRVVCSELASASIDSIVEAKFYLTRGVL